MSERMVTGFSMARTEPDIVFQPGQDPSQRVTFYAKGKNVKDAFNNCLKQMRDHGLYDVDEFQSWADVQSNLRKLETGEPAGVVLSIS